MRPGRQVLPPCPSGGATRLELGDCLKLTCDAPWPLRLVVTPRHAAQYAEVFSALLRARRAALRLEALWGRLCARGGARAAAAAEAAAGAPGGARRLRAWVQLAAHCVRSVRAFTHEQLLGGLCEELARGLEERPATVGEMRAAHDAMLARARHVCLLPPAAADAAGASGAAQEQPWAAGLSSEVHGLISCCWRLQALSAAAVRADPAAGGRPEGGAAEAGEGPNGWQELEAAGEELGARLARAKEQLRVAAASEPLWEGLLARLG